MTSQRDPRHNCGFLLTGDSNIVHLEAQLFYQIIDPAAYMIAQRSCGAGAAAAVHRQRDLGRSRRRDLDSILVARPEVAVASRRSRASASGCAPI